MGRLGLLVCVGVIFVASAVSVVIDPRGARPVEQGTRGDKCATQKEWPFCTSDEWGSKCPSGCRIQGLLDKYDHSQLRRIEKIRSLLDQNKAKHRSADQVSKQTYEYLKEKLIVDSGNDNSYFDLAQNLRQRIIDMKIKIDRQLRVLGALKERVRDQVVEMQRLEVDIDIKLRSCKGSCKSYSEYEVDRESYVELNKQVDQLAAHDAQSVETVSSLYVMKSRPLQGVLVDPKYKSGISGVSVAGQQKEDLFPEVKTVQLVLEQEGSSSSPATISKHQGTSSSQSRHSSSSTSSITDIGGGGGGPFFGPGPVQPQPGTGHSITRIEGGGGDHFFGPGPVQPQPGTGHTTTRVEAGSSGHYFGPGPVQVQPSTSHTTTRTTCTKTVRRTVVHTKDGPVERTEEVMGGGPECQGLDLTKGGMGSFFPSLSHVSTSSSSSSASSSLSHTGGTKGSLFGDHKSGFGDPFASDFAAFRTANTEDDIPDFHARSVKSSRFERHADYVGKVCVRLGQQSQDGRQSLRPTHGYRRQQCQARSGLPLCTDDDWVSKCPSGCRLQGLISQMESELEKKMRKVCKDSETYEDASEKSMTTMTHIYNSNRKVLVNEYMSELKFVDYAEGLARNLTVLRKRSAKLSQQLKELSGNAQEQIEELYRTEVDIDMKLRACHGSCRSAVPFSVDHSSYQTLQTHMDQVDKTMNQRRKSAKPPVEIPHVKLQPVDIDVAPSAKYKSIPMVRKELLTQFEDIGQNHVVLENLLQEALDLSELE